MNFLICLQFLTDNTDFTVVGVIGPPGVGKSTIMNEIYGFDSSSPGMKFLFSESSNSICNGSFNWF